MKNHNKIDGKVKMVWDWLDEVGTPLTENEAQDLMDKERARRNLRKNKDEFTKSYNELHNLLK